MSKDTPKNDKPSVGWIGLGAMGSGMATSLASQAFSVKAYDVYPPSLGNVAAAGVTAASSPLEATQGVDILCLMVVNAAQVEDTLFGKEGVAEALEDGSVVVIFSTVPPSFYDALRDEFAIRGMNVGLVDSPVSGGSVRASQGQLAIMASGLPAHIAHAQPVLSALTQNPQGALSIVGNEVGVASNFKMINQVFCAVQIAATGESLAFAKALGLNVRMAWDVITHSSGESFMFTARGPWSFRPDGTIKSGMGIINKDIGIVMSEARKAHLPVPLSSAAETLYTAAFAAGLDKVDDARVSLLWERFGVGSIPEQGTEEEEKDKARLLEVEKKTGNIGKILLIGSGDFYTAKLEKAGGSVILFDPIAEGFATKSGDEYSSHLKDLKERIKGIGGVVVTGEQSAEELLLGSRGYYGIASIIEQSVPVIVNQTIPSSLANTLSAALSSRGLHLINAPITHPISPIIFASASSPSQLSSAYPILSALSDKVHYIPGDVTAASKVKAVNSLLEAIHLSVFCEGFALAAKKGMDLDTVYQVVANGAARSFIMVDRWSRLQDPEPEVWNTLRSLHHDFAVVIQEAKSVQCPLFLGQAAGLQLERAVGAGWRDQDDVYLRRLWEGEGVFLAKKSQKSG
ncbi:hypothetical protein B9479_004534 [Cryptococcus floricola]|uniref:3-hydroxyisobutyrate dehydrogenase n=1 Tax=Cryptococcus floricola TaxID=2591691 RepID=A0A5D3ATF7_9TREE|nr:hypothetical protein B9479_004534 [Cryptococcus floricola]